MTPVDGPTRPFQLQILPGDPRHRTRQLRMTRRGSRILGLLLLLAALPVLAGWAVLPWMVWSRVSHRDVRVQVVRRAQQGERLQRLVGDLAELGERADTLERRAVKMRILLELGPPPTRRQPAEVAASGELDGSLAVAGRRGMTVISAIEARFADLAASLELIEARVGRQPTALATTPSIYPLGAAESVLVAGFGPRRNPFTQQLDDHSGIDVAAPIGTPVLAPADGSVVFAGTFDRREGEWWRLGQVVALRHGERFLTLFGHCDRLTVRGGERVARGQPIAFVGKTGWSTTVHLYYEIRRREPNGTWRPVDPRLFILDQSWEDEDRLLAAGWSAPSASFAALPRALVR